MIGYICDETLVDLARAARSGINGESSLEQKLFDDEREEKVLMVR